MVIDYYNVLHSEDADDSKRIRKMLRHHPSDYKDVRQHGGAFFSFWFNSSEHPHLSQFDEYLLAIEDVADGEIEQHKVEGIG